MIQKYIGHRPDLALTILRIVIGIIFLAHGLDKLLGDGGASGVSMFLASLGIPLAGVMAWVLIATETLGGLALILGFGTRIAAILLSIVMLVAIFTVKLERGLLGGYELDIALLASCLALLFQGAGYYSLDRIIEQKNI